MMADVGRRITNVSIPASTRYCCHGRSIDRKQKKIEGIDKNRSLYYTCGQVYLTHWGLKEAPFENAADGKFFYASGEHAEALSRLTYAAKQRKPLALFSGEYGTGKTMVCRALVGGLPGEQFKVIHVPNPLLSVVEIFGEILRPTLETVSIPSGKGELLRLLREVFIRNLNLGKHNLVIVDEAHLIEDISFFDELRMLLNYQHKQQLLLTLIFVGQSDLRDKISRLPALRQRISIQSHLSPMSQEDIGIYIQHRLKVAGCAAAARVFDPETFSTIFAHSKGIPRIINNICDLALLSGFQAKIGSIGGETLSDVLKEVPSHEEAQSSF